MDSYSQNKKPTDPSAEQAPDGRLGAPKRKSVIKKFSRKPDADSAEKSNSVAKIKGKKLSESSSSDDGQPEVKRTPEALPDLGCYASTTASTSDTPVRSNSPAATSSGKRWQDPEEVLQAKHAKDNLDQHNVPLSMISLPNAERMMQRMGYKPGTGLGRHGEGIREPIEPKPLAAKSGLGFSIPGLELGKQDWDFEADEVVIEEQVQWLPPPPTQWTFEELTSWRVIDKESLDISQCTDFCDKDVLQNILKSKDTLDAMDSRDFGRARFRSNPFETIGKAIFMNRAALKMANLDAILNFELTMSSPDSSLMSLPPIASDLFYFADVCAGPGGFSEYVLWKKGWYAKGFGFTLKGDCDFKLGDFIAGTPETFEPHYGVNDDGNIFDPRNIESFIAYVKSTTEEEGVHLMMADGGFSVDGQENIQEILSKQLYLSQIVVALAILRKGGNFICKLFDIFTPFSVGLIYLLRLCFDGVAIHKPNTSRPANSERYVLCKRRKPSESIEPTLKYLLDTHELMWQLSRDKANNNPKKDVMELVPLNILLDDEEFHTYIYNSNNHLGERQVQNLKKIVAFYRDRNLIEKRQHETKLHCLKYWKVPIERRRAFPGGAAPEPPQAKFYDLLKSDDASFIRKDEIELTTSSMTSTFRSPCDWAAVAVCGDKNRSKRGFYLGLGGTKVFRFTGARWEPVDIRMELCKDTLVYGEIVDEVRDITKPSTSRRVAFHIIDAMVLGGEDIRSRDFWERQRMCEKFAKAVNKPSVLTFAEVRVKQVIHVESIGPDLLQRLSGRPAGSKIYLPIDLDNEPTNILVGGLLFLKLSSDAWMIAYSKSQNKQYYYNTNTRYSCFEMIPDAYADFKYTMSTRVVWWWDSQTNFETDDPTPDSSQAPTPGGRVHAAPFLRFMQSIPS